MNTLNQPAKILRRAIMRRIWYSYLLSVTLSFAALRGFVLGVSAMLFVTLVSLPSIISNILAVPLGVLPDYVWTTITSAFSNGEFLTLLTFGLIIFSLLSFRFTFPKTTHSSLHSAELSA
jgi:FtsH-binding integral membrane protein